MSLTLVLLSGNEEAPTLLQMLSAHGRGVTLRHVVDLPGLRALLPDLGSKARLLSYLSNVIVPADCLAAFSLGCYNVHPASPDYPGTAPEAWAAYERAATFGATFHAMDERIDAGTIIDAEILPVTGPKDRPGLARVARQALSLLLVRIAPLLTREAPLVPLRALSWGANKRTVADFERICRFPADITKAELEHRLMSFGPPGPVEFSVDLHGWRFVMEAPGGIMGHLDPPQPDRVLGWVRDAAAPTARQEVKLTVDGQEFLLVADTYRPDVAGAGFGDGHSGFVWETPARFCDGRPHRIEVSCKGRPVPGSPRLAVFPRQSDPQSAA
ncbi:formyltransferase family protein [Solidesulfovibrio sp.]